MGFGYNEFDTGFGMGFQLFDVMFFLIFFLILGMFLFMIVKGLSTWNKNNQSPRLTVDATVVAKRTDVTHHHNGDNMATHSIMSIQPNASLTMIGLAAPVSTMVGIILNVGFFTWISNRRHLPRS